MPNGRNIVLAGDYEGKGLFVIRGFPEKLAIVLKTFGTSNRIILDKTTVDSYEIITEELTKSTSSAIMRGALGGLLLGPVGLLAGVSAKNKGAHTVAVLFKDGKKSLIEIDDKAYKTLIKNCF